MVHAIALVVVLQMSNLADVPRATVASAQAEVARLYRDIGVDIEWTPRGGVDDAVRVVVVPCETGGLRDRSKAAMGAAVQVSRHTRVAYVFFGPLARAADRYAVSVEMVLACAIAHEVGHLL